MKVAILLLVFSTVCRLRAQPSDAYAFKVHVLNSVTGAPIAGANVALSSTSGVVAFGRSDAAGVFSQRVPSAEKYLLSVTHKGYKMTGEEGLGRTIDLSQGGEHETTVQMLQLGVLAGRVLDQFGDPVRNAIVRAIDKTRISGNEYYEGFSDALTDDQGEYRIANVQPGRHYVGAEYSSNDSLARRGRFQWPEIGGYVLFPDAVEIQRAQELEVSAGATTHVDDMVLKMQRAVRVSGRVTPPPQGKVAGLNLHRSGPNLGLNVFAVRAGSCDSDGAFVLEALPGRYLLSASDQNTGKMSPEVTVEVSGNNVENVELTLSAGYEINGRITVDGKELLDLSKLTLNFTGLPVKIGMDGTFHSNAFGSQAAYVLQGLSEDWYIERVVVAGLPITGRRFSLRPGSTDVSIMVNPHGAALLLKPEPARTGFDAVGVVVLLPDTGPAPDLESVLHSMPEPDGALVIHAVPPGAYRAFGLGMADSLMMMRPDLLLEKYRNLAPLIRVSKGERITISVPKVQFN